MKKKILFTMIGCMAFQFLFAGCGKVEEDIFGEASLVIEESESFEESFHIEMTSEESASTEIKDADTKQSNRLKMQPIPVTISQDSDNSVGISNIQIKNTEGWSIEETEDVPILKDVHEEHSALYLSNLEFQVFEVLELPTNQRQLAYDLLHTLHMKEGICRVYYEGDKVPMNQIIMSIEENKTQISIFCVETSNQTIELYAVKGLENVAYSEEENENFEDFVDHGEVLGGTNGKVISREKQEKGEYQLLSEQEENGVLYQQKGDYSSRTLAYAVAQDGIVGETKTIPEKIEYGEKIIDINDDGVKDLFPYPYALFDINDEKQVFGYIWDANTHSFNLLQKKEILDQYGETLKQKYYGQAVGSERISEDFIQSISQGLVVSYDYAWGTLEKKFLQRELSESELIKISKSSEDVRVDLSFYNGDSTMFADWYLVDVDQDGIEDIFSQQYEGGSGGFVAMSFYKGDGKGGYERTYTEESILHDFGFVEWEGTNYLIEEIFDYNRKTSYGVAINYFENGTLSGRCFLTQERKDPQNGVTITDSYVKDGKYAGLTEGLKSFTPDRFIDGEDGIIQLKGSAEKEMESNQYEGDLNNDGKMDTYEKYVFYPSNMLKMYMYVAIKEDAELEETIRNILYSDDQSDIPSVMWLDKSEWGNIIYVLYQDTMYDFHINSYLVKDGTTEKLTQTDFVYELGIKRE